jgi:exonuclease III
VTLIPHSHQWIGHPDQKSTRNLQNYSTLDQMELAGIYRIFHPMDTKYTFFSAAHRTFSKIDYILGHKGLTNTKKLK